MHIRKLLCLCFCLLLAGSAFAAKYTMSYEQMGPDDKVKSWSVRGTSAAYMALFHYVSVAVQGLDLAERERAYQYFTNDLAKQFDLAQADRHLYRLEVLEQNDDQTILGFRNDDLAKSASTVIRRFKIKNVYLGINERKGNKRLVIIVQDEYDRYGAFVALPKGTKLPDYVNCAGSTFNVELTSDDPELSGSSEIQFGKINENGRIILSSRFGLRDLGVASLGPIDWQGKQAKDQQEANLSWIERHR